MEINEVSSPPYPISYFNSRHQLLSDFSHALSQYCPLIAINWNIKYVVLLKELLDRSKDVLHAWRQINRAKFEQYYK